MRRWNLL